MATRYLNKCFFHRITNFLDTREITELDIYTCHAWHDKRVPLFSTLKNSDDSETGYNKYGQDSAIIVVKWGKSATRQIKFVR